MKDTFLNKDTAKHYKLIHKILQHGRSNPIANENNNDLGWIMFGIAGVIALLMLIGPCEPAHAYTDEQYVNAIYKAEGGIYAAYPFGIRSTTCSTFQACKEICLRTVRNNRKRFKRSGYKRYPVFIQYLANRYCPTTGRSLTESERRLNSNWIGNMEYFLRRDA